MLKRDAAAVSGHAVFSNRLDGSKSFQAKQISFLLELAACTAAVRVPVDFALRAMLDSSS